MSNFLVLVGVMVKEVMMRKRPLMTNSLVLVAVTVMEVMIRKRPLMTNYLVLVVVMVTVVMMVVVVDYEHAVTRWKISSPGCLPEDTKRFLMVKKFRSQGLVLNSVFFLFAESLPL